MKKKNLAALIVSLLIILLITAPLFFVIYSLSDEISISYAILKQRLDSGDLFNMGCDTADNLLCTVSDHVKRFMRDPQIENQVNYIINQLNTRASTRISGFIFSIPTIVVNFFIMIFVVFYLFRDGGEIILKIRGILPIGESHQGKLFKKFNDVTFAVVYGNIFVALIQGILGGLGFFLFGINSPILGGILIAFAALIPYVGTVIIWLPVALLFISKGYIQGVNSYIINGILFLVYGLFISSIDNILKPKIIGDRAKVHPILVLLGVLGGLKMFGFIGIIIGPVVLALFTTFIKLYRKEPNLK